MAPIVLDFVHEKGTWLRSVRRIRLHLRRGKTQIGILAAGLVLGLLTRNWALVVVVVVMVGWIWIQPARLFGRSELLHTQFRYEIDAAGWTVTTAQATTRFAWSDVDRVVDTSEALLLIHGDRRTATILPRSAFSSDADMARVRELAGN